MPKNNPPSSNSTPSIAIDDTVLFYTENAAAITVDYLANVSDSDGDADWNGGSLDVQITANSEAADRISIADADGDDIIITVSGKNIYANAVDIGNLSTLNGMVTAGKLLTITFDADATNADVQEVLQSIRFDNTSDNPGMSDRTVTLTVTDKNAASASGERTVTLVAVNDAPTITRLDENSLTYTEGDGATIIDQNARALVEDVDSTDFEGGSLVATISTGGGVSEDILGLNAGGTVTLAGVTAGSEVSVGGTVIGTLGTIAAGNDLVVNLNANATATNVQTLIWAITYQNSNIQAPTTGTRTVSVTLHDGDGGSSNTSAVSVIVEGVNDAPTLVATGNNPVFNQGGIAADLFDNITVSTVESGQALEQLVISVTNVSDGATEWLVIDSQDVALSDGHTGITSANGINYSVTLKAGKATVTLNKTGMSAADVQTLVDSLAYRNTSITPSDSGRVVTITGLKDNGGTANGGADTASLSIVSTVAVVPNPLITGVVYDGSVGTLVVSGTHFQPNSSEADIDASLFSLTGEGGETYTLNDTTDVEIDSATQFILTLGATDRPAISQIFNKSGVSSTGGTQYNLAVSDNWNTQATSGDTSDAINAISVVNVVSPVITDAAYDAASGVLFVAGTGLLKLAGANNDIDASLFTFTGLGMQTYTLTDTADVDITSGTSFTLTLSAADKSGVNALLDTGGTSASDATVYNLAAAEDWAAGADAAVNTVDATGNGITVTVPAPAPAPAPAPQTSTATATATATATNTSTPPASSSSIFPATHLTTLSADGTAVSIQVEADGTVTLAVSVIDTTRIDDPDSLFRAHADIPVLVSDAGNPTLVISLPEGVGLAVNGRFGGMPVPDARNDLTQRLVQRLDRVMDNGSDALLEMTAHGRAFIASLAVDDIVSVQTVTLIARDDHAPGQPIIITGSDLPGSGKQALVIDASSLPSGSIIQLDGIAFAAIIGDVRVIGGMGENFVENDARNAFIVLGPDDDVLFGGDGNDTIGSLGGNDQVYGDGGNDIIYGGAGHDILTGGSGNDKINGGTGYDIALQPGQLSDYQVRLDGSQVTLIGQDGEKDVLADIEQVMFDSGPGLTIAYSEAEAAAHHLVNTWFGRDLMPVESDAIQNWMGVTVSDITNIFRNFPEAIAFQNMTIEELLAGLDDNPNIIRLDASRHWVGNDADDQGYLPPGLALHVDGGEGFDVLRMTGNRNDVHLEQLGNAVEITRLEDGAMSSLKNAEMIAFDSGENILLAHSRAESILGRLFQTFFDRDATPGEWQSGLEALANDINPELILDWFQSRAGLGVLDNADYIQAIYSQTFDRSATESELNSYQSRLENGEIAREWLAVELAGSDEAIAVIGSVIQFDSDW